MMDTRHHHRGQCDASCQSVVTVSQSQERTSWYPPRPRTEATRPPAWRTCTGPAATSPTGLCCQELSQRECYQSIKSHQRFTWIPFEHRCHLTFSLTATVKPRVPLTRTSWRGWSASTMRTPGCSGHTQIPRR